MKEKILSKISDPRFLKAVHGWLTIAWLLVTPPIVIWFRDSIPLLVFISVYANFVGHFSSWQASRVEVTQFDDANVQDVIDYLKGESNEEVFEDTEKGSPRAPSASSY